MTFSFRRWTAALATGLALSVLATTAMAQDLTVGLAAEVTTPDPHFQNAGPNNGFATTVYDRLMLQDENQRLVPGLALSWEAVDDLTWEFKLREDVKFHDGSPFEAEDVASSIRRVAWVPNSPSSFAVFTRAFKSVDVLDAHTLRITTNTPYPLLPNDVSSINIVPRALENTPTADFTAGRASIGTGPFKLVSFTPGSGIELVRNDDYWGEKPSWERVHLRYLTNPAARVASLLSGDVDLIENTPTADIPRIEGDPNFRVVRATSNQVMYLHLDTFRDQIAWAKDASGATLEHNPLKDVRVREALSMAIDRGGLVARVMGGEAEPAGGLVPEGFFGFNADLKPIAYDPEKAKQLLAEAGYPYGFHLTIHGTNDRFLNDSRVLQAIASMFTRVGVITEVVSQPLASFLPPASNPSYEYSVILIGWNTNTGEASAPLRGVLATVDPDRGRGPSNRGRYSNPEVDRLLDEALATIDDTKREELLREAQAVALNEYAIIPLYFEITTWSSSKDVAYTPRADQWTLPQFVRPAQ